MWAALLRGLLTGGRAAGAAAKSAGRGVASAAASAGRQASAAVGRFQTARSGRVLKAIEENRRQSVEERMKLRKRLRAAGASPENVREASRVVAQRYETRRREHVSQLAGSAARPEGFGGIGGFLGGSGGRIGDIRMPSLGSVVSGLGNSAKGMTGIKDASEGLAKLLKGDLLGAITSFGKALVKKTVLMASVALGLEKFVGGLVESRRELARYNGAIAGAYGRLQHQDIRRNIHAANQAQGSTTTLVDSFNELKDAVQPLKEDIITVVNVVGIVAAKIGTVAAWLAKMNPIIQGIHFVAEKIEENTREDDPVDLPEWAMLNEMRKGDPLGFGNRPPLPPL